MIFSSTFLFYLFYHGKLFSVQFIIAYSVFTLNLLSILVQKYRHLNSAAYIPTAVMKTAPSWNAANVNSSVSVKVVEAGAEKDNRLPKLVGLCKIKD
jgi:hypothetical protein